MRISKVFIQLVDDRNLGFRIKYIIEYWTRTGSRSVASAHCHVCCWSQFLQKIIALETKRDSINKVSRHVVIKFIRKINFNFKITSIDKVEFWPLRMECSQLSFLTVHFISPVSKPRNWKESEPSLFCLLSLYWSRHKKGFWKHVKF